MLNYMSLCNLLARRFLPGMVNGLLAAAISCNDMAIYPLSQLRSITSVIGDFEFFVAEKWKIASDKSGSGNTANIGSIAKISELLNGNGMFSKLGESWFDDYWMNYGKITMTTEAGKTRKITNLVDFVNYRGGDTSLIVPKARKRKARKRSGD